MKLLGQLEPNFAGRMFCFWLPATWTTFSESTGPHELLHNKMMFVKSSTKSNHLFSFRWETLKQWAFLVSDVLKQWAFLVSNVLKQWAFLVSDVLKQWKKIFVKVTTNSDYLWISIRFASMSVMVCTCSYTKISYVVLIVQNMVIMQIFLLFSTL